MESWVGLNPPYGCAVVDAPWKFDRTQRLSAKGRRSAAAKDHYSTLTPAQLAALPVGELLADSAHLWLWVPNALLAAGRHRSVIESWGLRPITLVTWCKQGQPGLGRYVRNTTESAVLAVKGWGTVPDVPLESSWWLWKRGAHSQKPGAFGDLVEQVSPGPYVELFARQQRLGWDSHGFGYEMGATA